MAERDPALPKRKSLKRRIGNEILVALIVILGLVAGALVFIDTGPGHRFLIDRIEERDLGGGLRAKIGRIDGSIYNEMVLRNVELHDPEGVFLTSPEIQVDWAPTAWLYDKLHIDRLESPQVTLLRLPRTTPSNEDKPILPAFDIHIGRLAIDRLVVEKEVTGTARSGSVEGALTIRAGRALARLDAALDGGDSVRLGLDAAPDADRLDLSLVAEAPGDGLIPTLLGVDEAVTARIEGKGSWSDWAGAANMTLGDETVADLDLRAADGRYGIEGTVRAAPFLSGTAATLLAGDSRIEADVAQGGQLYSGNVRLSGNALSLVADGAVDLAAERFVDLAIGAELKRPSALIAQASGAPVRLSLTLDGAFDTVRFAYRATAPRLSVDGTTLIDAQADGQGNWSRLPRRIPLTFSARRVTGAGPQVEKILQNLEVRGILMWSDSQLRGDDLQYRTRRLSGTLDVLVDLATGATAVALDGRLPGYEIPGLGRVDVTADLDLDERGFRGRARAEVTRFDNEFLAGIAGGNPVIETRIAQGPGGELRFDNLSIEAPKLSLSGSGRRRADGTFAFEAEGTHDDYGPVILTLDGELTRPTILLQLAAPNEALGLRDVTLDLTPDENGFLYEAEGQSRFGPFASEGAILLPEGRQGAVDIASLRLAGSEGSGRLNIVEGGLDGTLRLAGGEIGGTIAIAPVGDGQQRIALELTLDDANFPGPPPMQFADGDVDAVILLGGDGGLQAQGRIATRRADIGGLDVTRLDASVRYANGRGSFDAQMEGQRGADFDLVLSGTLAPDRITIGAEGNLEGDALELTSPAILVADADGNWRLQATSLTYGRGSATVSGQLGPVPRFAAELKRMPLRIFDLVDAEIELGGTADGSIDLDLGAQPSGEVDLKVRGLTRSGLLTASQPIDVALRGRLDKGIAGFRAVAALDGETVGRAQARIRLNGRGGLPGQLMASPLLAQLRYDGPADALWRLSGFELFDLTGPLEAGVDVRGSLLVPRIAGRLSTEGARIESPVSGTVVENLRGDGRFSGSRLTLSGIAGTTPGGGSVSGSGALDFAGGAIGIEMDFQADRAKLLDRDDIAATVTGPLRIRSDGNGGTISGDVDLVDGRFRLGTAGTVAAVPRLDVVERGTPPGQLITRQQLVPWRLDVDVTGGPLAVRGLGIESEWSTDLAIGGTLDDPRMRGEARLIRGDYDFAGRNFRLQNGLIRFRSESPPDPLLDIEADADVSGLSATVNVEGTGANPRIRFTSVPALPEDELLSRILFGTSITNLSAAEAVQLAAAVASLQGGGGGLDPINALRNAVGLDRLRILPADVATGQGTSIAAGKNITRRLYVEVITDGDDYTATQLEYRVTRWLSILATVSSLGRVGANARISKDY
ncbi:translocation/assembly module TamB domain-containing protein [Sphingomicrobium clamense]|uniref:Translocation/assembly module TamB domain-containing protein n=1 Tax=Sphingomicrobium clamense TaxID=2851013 RepID=A0ABS6V8M9_9SPHN|nr:translocation/assembly module TamB domain-containing protein [Sphingomicrobium sp. B8]MBW0145418.1 translocation/assembly module TamB domain-containing protein [Sphingomicrobium sp. B8]